MTNSLKKYSQDPYILVLLVVSEVLIHICVKSTEKMIQFVLLCTFLVFCYCLKYILRTHNVTHKMGVFYVSYFSKMIETHVNCFVLVPNHTNSYDAIYCKQLHLFPHCKKPNTKHTELF